MRISIIMTVLVAMVFSVGSTIIIHRSYMASLDREEQEAVDNLQMVNSIFRLNYENSGKLSEDEILKILRRIGTYRTSADVFLLYKDEDLIYGNLQNKEVNLNVNTLLDTMGDDEGITVNYKSDKTGLKYIISASGINIGEDRYIICICRDIGNVIDLRNRLHSLFIKAFLVIMFLTVLTSWIISSIIVKPLNKLKKATREIADGNLSYRTDIKSNDEIGELSRNFDKMAAELDNNVTLLREAAEEKDRFMGAFTHELKTPMTSIIGYAELLRTQELDQEDREDALNYIYSESKRLESMSLKLLQLFVADKDKLDLKKVSPKDMVEDIVVHLTPTLNEQNIKIICRTEEGIAFLEPDLVRTLIINLIDNARKAMDKKGRIRVDQKMAEDGVIFIITDNGKGMPKEALEHVTEAFYRVDKSRSRAQGGAGLGLSLVKKIVELHNGEISFSSEQGIGTVVTVKLKGGVA
ncbi:MAG: HAMP domain-containing histidine kinase [Eubacterium sp.]|nr:HAMP domain-containing histidine kinase [Eubacterium sp.]